jgi:hypothetical protein
MSEFTGGVALAQLRKLDMVVRDIRANARRVYEGIRDLPPLQDEGAARPVSRSHEG